MRDANRAAALAATAATWLAAGVCMLAVAFEAGRPLDDPDLWWHLAMGAHYAAEGPWPEGDPLLHTALAEAPIQHEWLFGVAVHGIESVAGFSGLRATHVLAALFTLGLVGWLLRRGARSIPVALAGSCVFAALAVWRLAQSRPDLVSIPAAIAVVALLIQPTGVPSWARVAAVAVGVAIWANIHSLFAIGPALLIAAGIGLALRTALCRIFDVVDPTPPLPLAARWAGAFAAFVGLSALNPRGFEQHLTFATSSNETAIWVVKDEWTHFDPFHYAAEYGAAVSPFSFWLTNAVLVVFLITALAAFGAFVRRPGPKTLASADPVFFGLGAAGVVALLVSLRFQWMLAFPLLFIARSVRFSIATGPDRNGPVAIGAALVAGVAAVGMISSGVGPQPSTFKRDRLARYFSSAYEPAPFAVAGVDFLRDHSVQGRLFNAYSMGGFLGYWTDADLRTFIDGRTEHSSPDVLRDYLAVNDGRGAQPGETFLDVLDRRDVDVFFGAGLPLERSGDDFKPYTTTHLAGRAGWILVDRGIDRAVYVRDSAAQAKTLAAIEAHYAETGIPFDRHHGLDVAAVIEQQPEWARERGLVPVDEARLQAMLGVTTGSRRTIALEQLAIFRFLAGAYDAQIALDRELLSMRPQHKPSWRRLAVGLALDGHRAEAVRAARRLAELDPADTRSRAIGDAVRAWAANDSLAAEMRVRRLPILTRAEAAAILSGRVAPPPPLTR